MLTRIVDLFTIVVLSFITYNLLNSPVQDSIGILSGVICILTILLLIFKLYKNFKGESVGIRNLRGNRYIQLFVLLLSVGLIYYSWVNPFVKNKIIYLAVIPGVIYLAISTYNNWKKTL